MEDAGGHRQNRRGLHCSMHSGLAVLAPLPPFKFAYQNTPAGSGMQFVHPGLTTPADTAGAPHEGLADGLEI